MAPEKSPAFQFYAQDFMLGTVTMSLSERGAYITLLAYQWDVGSVPEDYDVLSRVLRCTRAQAAKSWLSIAYKFQRGADGGWRNARLERERAKQMAFRELQSQRGKASAANRKATETQPSFNRASTKAPLQPEGNSSSSSSSSSSTVLSEPKTGPPPPTARSKRPIFTGQRLTVFEWMLDDLSKLLGAHFEDFDVHTWFFELDERTVAAGMVLPQRDGGAWLLAETLLEAHRRGLPIAVTAVPSAGKLTSRLAAALEEIRQETPA